MRSYERLYVYGNDVDIVVATTYRLRRRRIGHNEIVSQSVSQSSEIR